MADIMTAGYLTKLKAEMEGRLGCGIEVVEDGDSRYPCKLEYARDCRGEHGVGVRSSGRCINA